MKRFMIGLVFLAFIQVFSQTYNPEAAAAYANDWCGFNRNPVYNDYTGQGGDCANFVSQCLKAGGLDLSKGAPGMNLPNNGVDPYGCIPNVSALVLHLVNWQNTSHRKVFGYNPPAELNHDLGDPAFFGYSGPGIEASHSYFCSSLDWSARHLYSSHTSDRCNDELSETWGYLIFIHIKSSIPDHCTNCKLDTDKGEEGIDCGGPCPPCQHATDKVIINEPTSNLPSDVRAITEITAGNAAVKVLSGQNVTFTTAGTINLLPGFEVQAGGNFSSVAKGGILGVTADCNDFCYLSYKVPWIKIRYQDRFVIDNAPNTEKIYVVFYRQNDPSYNKWYLVFSEDVYVTHDGEVELWDLISHESSQFLKPGTWYWYFLDAWFYSCKGEWHQYKRYFFTIENPKNKSSIIDCDFEDPDNHPPTLSPPANNTIHQDETTVPNFSVTPNPNAGTFQLETNFPLSDIDHLKITNTVGAVVYESQHLASNEIQLQNSAPGLYFVVMVLKDGTVLTQKVMVQR